MFWDGKLSKIDAFDWKEEVEEKGLLILFCSTLLYAGDIEKPLLFNSELKHSITIIEDKIGPFLIFNFVVSIALLASYLYLNQSGVYVREHI